MKNLQWLKNNLSISNFLEKYITVVDISDSSICCFVYKVLPNTTYQLILREQVLADGFAKGKIIDAKLAIYSLNILFDKVESVIKTRLVDIIISNNSSWVKHIVHPLVYNVNSTIKQATLDRVFNIDFYAKDFEDYFISHMEVLNLKIDEQIISNPLGLYAKKIEADIHLIAFPKSYVINLYSIFDYLEMSIIAIIYSPFVLVDFLSNYAINDRHTFLTIDKHHSLFCDFQRTSRNITKLNWGINDIIDSLAQKINIDSKILLNYDVSNTVFNIKGKSIDFIDEANNIYKLQYKDFEEYLAESVKEYFDMMSNENISIELRNIKYIHTIIPSSNILILNELFTGLINDNIILNEQVKNYSDICDVKLEDVNALSTFCYYIKHYKTDANMEKFKKRLNKIVF
jgi:hypothetical protein